MNGLANMKELRFLQVYPKIVHFDHVSKWNFDDDNLHLPNALQFLSWDEYPFSSLPKTFLPNNLVGLELNFSYIGQLWKDGEEKPCLKLRFLKFRYSELRTLDLSVAPNLETLILEGCSSLVEVRFQVTPNLKELRIKNCCRLKKLHMPAECPNLRFLDLCDLKLRTLHLGVTPNLEELNLSTCTYMVELHMPAECPKLIILRLDNNSNLRTLDLGLIPNIEILILENCYDLEEINAPTECLWKDREEKPFLKLRFLKFTDAHYLRTLDLSVAPNLETLILEGCDNLVEVHFQVTPNLKELSIEHCYRLKKLHMPAECPKLRFLDLCDLNLRTLHLGVTPNLETLRVRDCANLVELQIPAECPKLVTLDLRYCIQVAKLPEEIGWLECLKELDITGTGISHLPESIFRMKGLRIVGSRRLLESCGFTSETKTSDYKTFCHI